MKIGIAGPVALSDVEHFLSPGQRAEGHEMRGSSLLVSLVERLLAFGHDVSVYSTEPTLELSEEAVDILEGPHFRFIRVPLRRSGFRSDRGRRGRMLDLFRFERRALERVIRHDAPDVMHAHWTYEFAWAALDSGLPCLVTCHDAPLAILRLDPSPYRFGRLMMARAVLKRARHLTAVSPYLLPPLHRLSREDIRVVPNPLPRALTESSGPRARPERRSGGLRVVMIINGWSARKNAACGMFGLAELKQRLHGVELMLIGPDFGAGEHAEAWAQKQGLAGLFVFAGAMPYAEAQAHLAKADLLVHPALEESFGMTIAEAMALGIPVVAGYASGAVPWVTGEGAAGLLVDVKSPAEIAEASMRLLEDETLYARCSQQGHRRAQEVFSADAVARSYIEEYHHLLCGSASDVAPSGEAMSKGKASC